MAQERIQKILAKAGIASRRKAEELITEGSVTVNGQVAKLGDKAEFGKDAIKVNGKLLHAIESTAYYVLHKPRGVISTLADPENRPTLTEFLGRIEQRVYPVGRLDFNSDGALLLTNDGNLAEQIQKRDDIPRVYHVKIKGHPSEDVLERLRKGAKVGHKLMKPHSVRLLSPLQNKSEIEFVMVGSGAFDVKAYFEMKGFLVDRITRFAIGQITIRGMLPGQLRQLEKSQVDALVEHPELGLRALEFEASKGEERRIRREKATARFEKREGFSREKRGGFGKKRFGEKREGFGGEKRGGFGGEKRGGFGGEKRGGFGGEKRGGFGGEKRGGFGGEKRGGFGKPRSFKSVSMPGESRERGFEGRGPRSPRGPRAGGRSRPSGSKIVVRRKPGRDE